MEKSINQKCYDPKWAKRFLDMAKLVASWSKDPSTKVGAVITKGVVVVSTGFNGFASGCSDCEDMYIDKEKKYSRIIHAEKNAILFANRPLNGHSLYCTHIPCAQCAASIVQVGISMVFIPEQEKDYMDRWHRSIFVSVDMFKEAGIEVFVLKEINEDKFALLSLETYLRGGTVCGL